MATYEVTLKVLVEEDRLPTEGGRSEIPRRLSDWPKGLVDLLVFKALGEMVASRDEIEEVTITLVDAD